MKRDKRIVKSIYTHEYRLVVSHLCRIRKELKISQRELADRLGVHHSYIAKIELAERRMDVIEFLRICAAMEHDPSPLIENIYGILARNGDTVQSRNDELVDA